MHRLTTTVIVALLGLACKSAADPSPADQPDTEPAAVADVSGTTDTTSDDVTPPPPACSCDDDDDCRACWEHVGVCCYEDPTVQGEIDRLVGNCERAPACRACCGECIERSCEEIIARHDCPNQ